MLRATYPDLKLEGCDFIVSQAERCLGSFWYVSDVPEWWLWVFYLALLAVLVLPGGSRRRR